jgi:hypothetical protein
MDPSVRLASLLAALLSQSAGCTLLFGPCDPSPMVLDVPVTVDPAKLQAALADGVLQHSECVDLCNDQGGSPTTSDALPTTTAATTGATSETGETTGTTGSTGGTGETMGSTGSTGTTGTTGTTGGTGETTGSTTGGPLRPRSGPHTGQLSCSAGKQPGEIVCTYTEASQECVSGRRPAGLVPATTRAADPCGAWLARAAHLEAASVPAFERLAAELALHGAPASLQAAARAAADDERRHAASMTAAAGRRGAAVAAVELTPTPPRTLRALALENAVEGCVRETWGALLAMHQARSAAPEVAATMAAIADDEARHGELAWAIDAWVRTRLGPDEVAALDAAIADAAAELRPREEPPAALVRELGLPTAARAAALWRALADALWTADRRRWRAPLVA